MEPSLPSPLPLLLLFSLHLIFFCHIVDAADTLLEGQFLKDDGQPLVSAGQVFALGFFSPGNSTNRYVGIWYHKVTGNAVVWVANRDRPIGGSAGTFTLGRDGNLVVSDKSGATLWSSSTSGGISSNTSARILDNGNLVVTSPAGDVVWQMFAHPGDTFLPGMKGGLDLRTGINTVWTSWTSADDPAPGRYSLGIDPRGLAQVVVWENNKNENNVMASSMLALGRWRSGLWNGQAFTGVWNMRPLNLFGFKFSNVEEEKKMYFTYTVYDSTYVRIVITPEGIDSHYHWKDNSTSWERVWAQPITACEVYNRCGPNAVCEEEGDDGQKPKCSCMRGFEPKAAEEWRSGNWSGGCVRKARLGCRGGSGSDGFWRMGGVKLADGSEWVGEANASGCGDVCGRNCSCTAYAYVNGIGCMVWGTDLVDVRSFPSGGDDVFLKVSASELLEKASKKRKLFILGIVLGVIFVILLIFVCWKFRSRIKALWMRRESEKQAFTNGEDKQGTVSDLPLFKFEAIAAATNDFSVSNMIGKGGFGPVYKGKMNEGQEIAVKRLSRDSGQGMEEFKNEVTLIAKLQHRNLVRLLGCCVEGDETILVYEYMPNKSLDFFLFDSENGASLNWETRFSIIEGIARGLLYLHRDSRLRIVHRDLKASNILLDEEMQPKISDFGIARIFGYNQNQANTNRVVGTYGYMSPEYAMDGFFSIKSDVYSFGVLLLEIISGRKNKASSDYQNFNNLLGQAWHAWDQGEAMEIVDPLIRSTCNKEEVMRCIQIGLSCIQDRTVDRPTMSSVVSMLGNESTCYSTPKQPTFTTKRSTSETDSSASGNTDGSSSANVTITIITGR